MKTFLIIAFIISAICSGCASRPQEQLSVESIDTEPLEISVKIIAEMEKYLGRPIPKKAKKMENVNLWALVQPKTDDIARHLYLSESDGNKGIVDDVRYTFSTDTAGILDDPRKEIVAWLDTYGTRKWYEGINRDDEGILWRLDTSPFNSRPLVVIYRSQYVDRSTESLAYGYALGILIRDYSDIYDVFGTLYDY